MGFVSVLGCAGQLVTKALQPGDLAIDATIGNGVDTLLLAERVGKRGKVWGFDIQPEALVRTKERLQQASKPEPRGEASLLERVSLHQQCHSGMANVIPAPYHGQIGAIMFNLGYLPGGDQERVTLPQTTLAALEVSLTLLRTHGVITVMLYTGHEGGAGEAEHVEAWAASLPIERYETLRYQFTNRQGAPYLLAISKRK